MRFRYCLLTSRAVVGVLTAASGFVAIRQRRMAKGRNIFCFCLTTDRTGIGFKPSFFTTCLSCYSTFIPLMLTGSRNFFFLRCSRGCTTRSSTCKGFYSIFATGRLFCYLAIIPYMLVLNWFLSFRRSFWFLCRGGLRRCCLRSRPQIFLSACHCRWHHGADHGKGQEQ